MNYLKKFNEYLIIESSKSYEIDMVCRLISNFFIKNGFNEKKEFFAEVKSPYFQIVSDRNYLKTNIINYKNHDHYLTKGMMKHGHKQEDLIKKAEEALNEFTHGDIFIFTDYNNPEISSKLLEIIDGVGYFVSVVTLDKENNKLKDKSLIKDTMSKLDKISIIIEPTYDREVNFEGDYLYHTTDKKYLDKIMKIGLVPKSKNTRSFYPDRIFLSPNEEYMDSIQSQLKTDKEGEYLNLKIKNFKGLTLYKDVRFKGGFYTYNNIHPKYIKII